MAKQAHTPLKVNLLSVGRTLILTIDGKKADPLTLQEKEKRDNIRQLVESYKKLPSQAKLDKLTKLFNPKKEAKLLAQKVEKKQKKQTVKELEAQLQAEIKKNKELEETITTLKTTSIATPAPIQEELIKKAEKVPESASTTGKSWGGEYGGRN